MVLRVPSGRAAGLADDTKEGFCNYLAMKSSSALTVSATGDSLMVAPFPDSYAGDLAEIREFLAEANVRLTNLETNIAPFGDFNSAFSGGTWLNTEPDTFEHLLGYGFNYFGTANNHALDYSYFGLLSTLKTP